MGIALKRGRYFAERWDRLGVVAVAIISQSMADVFWPGKDPLGRTFLFGGDGPPVQVIGAGDVRRR